MSKSYKEKYITNVPDPGREMPCRQPPKRPNPKPQPQKKKNRWGLEAADIMIIVFLLALLFFTEYAGK